MDAATPTPGAAHQLAGFVRHVFTAAFYHLGQGTDYREALAATLAQGGDTDTNACIVGGLIGALHGIEGIPPEMLDGLLNCDTRKGRMRPDEYTIKPVPGNLGRLGAVLWPLTTDAGRKNWTGGRVENCLRGEWASPHSSVTGQVPCVRQDLTQASLILGIRLAGIAWPIVSFHHFTLRCIIHEFGFVFRAFAE